MWRRDEGGNKPAPLPRPVAARSTSLESAPRLPKPAGPTTLIRSTREHAATDLLGFELRSAFVVRGLVSTSTIGPPPGGTTRRVLVASGDPRPGSNQFGLEAAEIRRCLLPAGIEVREVACVELVEISHHLDALAPAVLHLAAHHASGGVAVGFEGDLLWAEFEAVATAVCRARFPPRLVVAGLCDSLALANLLADTIDAVIAWPDTVDDEQTRAFAGMLYRALAAGRTVDDATKDPALALKTRWPGLDGPVLFGLGATRPVR